MNTTENNIYTLTQDERVTAIIDFEGGEIDENNLLILFSDLIRSGMAWSLQGFYGRAAAQLIENEQITKEGQIISEFFNL